MINNFFQHTQNPRGFLGRLMLRTMNTGHSSLASWGMDHLQFTPGIRILDIGCGGGENIHTMLTGISGSQVDGIDYSEESVAFSRKTNAPFLGTRSTIQQGNAISLPFGDNMYDIVTAFETVYFWNNISRAFMEVYRVMKPGGTFMICCVADDPSDTTWTKKIKGMRVYSGDELTGLLSGPGFTGIACDRNPRGWICVTAGK